MESLRAMLNEGSVAQWSFKPLLVGDGTRCDFTDWLVIRSNAMFASDPDYLKVMDFQDAFEVAFRSAKQKAQSFSCLLQLSTPLINY